MKLKLHIHIITAGRLALLKECLESVFKALPENATIAVVVNGDHPETTKWLATLNHPALEWSVLPRESRPRARNRAFETTGQNEIIYFLDDDVRVPEHLFERALQKFQENPDVAILGGPNLTPPGVGKAEALFGAIMTSVTAAPFVRVRYGSHNIAKIPASECDLILCNLAIRKSAIPKEVRLLDGLKSNEENLFIHECSQRGLISAFFSELFVYHHRRKTILSFFQQVSSYGYGRAQQTIADFRSFEFAFFAPAIALLLAIPILMTSPLLFDGLLASYVIAALLGGFYSSRIRSLGVLGIAMSVPLTLLVHFAYGIGFWRGVRRCSKEAFQKFVVGLSTDLAQSQSRI